MEGPVMALRQGSETFTKWVHVENGNVVVRRLHRIVLQTHDRGPQTISGDKLPDSIQTWTSHPYVGVGASKILGSPKSVSRQSRRKKCHLPVTATWWLPRDARRRLEALHQAIALSTRLDHVEGEEPLHRQVRRIEIQTHGDLYSLTGTRLPQYIAIHTGAGFKGRHTAQVLLRPESDGDGLLQLAGNPPVPGAWPLLRDVMHIALGMVGFLLLRFFLELITGVA